MNPEAHVNRSRWAAYWADYGQALARLRGRHDDAVMALRRAELISPHRIQRNPIIRNVLTVLLRRSRRGSPRTRSCGAWPAGPVCPYSPSGGCAS